jgi:pilus assembly protein Flp/PilA
MTNLIERFAKDESGATAIEYGLIAAGISVAIITVVNTLDQHFLAARHRRQITGAVGRKQSPGCKAGALMLG